MENSTLNRRRSDKAGMLIIALILVIPIVLVSSSTTISYYQRNSPLEVRVYSTKIIQQQGKSIAVLVLSYPPCLTETVVTMQGSASVFKIHISRSWMQPLDTGIFNIPHIQCTLYGIVRLQVSTEETVVLGEELPPGVYSLQINGVTQIFSIPVSN